MTLNRGLRTAIVITLTVATALTVWFWGNQRHAQAEETLAGQILCYINSVAGPPVPRFHADECPRPAPPPGFSPSCSNNIDDDGDGLIDWGPLGGDPGCATPLDTDETDTAPPPPPPPPPSGAENTLALCSDDLDNDGDSLVDLADPSCFAFKAFLVVTKTVINDNGGVATVSDFSLHATQSSPGSSETVGVSSGATTTVLIGTWIVGEASNAAYTATYGGDCNLQGEVTLAAGETKTCTLINNDIAPGAPSCANGIDDDGDGLIDSADPGCSSSTDNDETDLPSGGTGEGGAAPASGGGGGGGGGGGRGGGAISFVAPTAAVPPVSTIPPFAGSCDTYLTAFIRFDLKNDPEQVRRLQAVLKEFEGAALTVNGVYDLATLAAVNAFQLKYAKEILTPWGASRPTGFVYLTTRKKINEIYCRNTRQFTLTPEQLRIIEQTRVKLQPSQLEPVSPAAPALPSVKAPPPTTTPPPEIGTEKGAAAQTAAVGEAVGDSTPKKGFWSCVVDFFRNL